MARDGVGYARWVLSQRLILSRFRWLKKNFKKYKIVVVRWGRMCYMLCMGKSAHNRASRAHKQKAIIMTRKAISNKMYLNANGERTNSPADDTVGNIFQFFGDDTDAEGKPIVSAEHVIMHNVLPAAILIKATAMGLAQKIGDAWAGKGEEAEEICLTMFERLSNGEWNIPKSAGVGPRPSMVINAVLAVLEANGAPADEETRDALAESLADADARKSALTNPAIRAEYDKLRAAAAAERAAASAAKAEGMDSSDLLASLLG